MGAEVGRGGDRAELGSETQPSPICLTGAEAGEPQVVDEEPSLGRAPSLKLGWKAERVIDAGIGEGRAQNMALELSTLVGPAQREARAWEDQAGWGRPTGRTQLLENPIYC